MDWVHCNCCFLQGVSNDQYHLSRCGHIICERCMTSGAPNRCPKCQIQSQLTRLSRLAQPEMKMFFENPRVLCNTNLQGISVRMSAIYEELVGMRKDMETATKRTKEIEKELREMKQTITGALSCVLKVVDYQTKNKVALGEAKAAKSERNNLKRELNKAQQENSKLHSELEKLRSAVNKLQEQAQRAAYEKQQQRDRYEQQQRQHEQQQRQLQHERQQRLLHHRQQQRESQRREDQAKHEFVYGERTMSTSAADRRRRNYADTSINFHKDRISLPQSSHSEESSSKSGGTHAVSPGLNRSHCMTSLSQESFRRHNERRGPYNDHTAAREKKRHGGGRF